MVLKIGIIVYLFTFFTIPQILIRVPSGIYLMLWRSITGSNISSSYVLLVSYSGISYNIITLLV